MMKELLKKLQKKSNKKGFTLVEIIVVLVILAILAAIAVPSVIGYVDEAKESRYIQEARSIYVVIQTEEAKVAALGETDYSSLYTSGAPTTEFKDKIKNTTTLEVTAINVTEDDTSTTTPKKNKEWTVTWKSDDGKTINATIKKNKDIKINSKSK